MSWPKSVSIAEIFAAISSESSYPWIALRDETDDVEE
jgi:hypothetical protein